MEGLFLVRVYGVKENKLRLHDIFCAASTSPNCSTSTQNNQLSWNNSRALPSNLRDYLAKCQQSQTYQGGLAIIFYTWNDFDESYADLAICCD